MIAAIIPEKEGSYERRMLKVRTNRFLKHPLRLLLILTALHLASACASDPSAGINRHQLFPEKQIVALPFRIVVDEKSKTKQESTLLQPLQPSYEHTYNAAFPLASSIGYSVGSGINRLRKNASLKDFYLAGEAFQNAMNRVSYSGPRAVPTITVELVQFQPVKRGKGFGTDLIVFLLFNASFVDSRISTQSSYRFDYNMGWSDDKNDILRELTDYAVGHWANELLVHSQATKGGVDFPSPKSERFKIDRLVCSYDLFSPFVPGKAEGSQIAEDLMPVSAVAGSNHGKEPGEPVDQLPMYGGTNCDALPVLREADKTFIQETAAEFGSREKASAVFVERGFSLYKQDNLDQATRRFNQAWLLNPTTQKSIGGSLPFFMIGKNTVTQ